MATLQPDVDENGNPETPLGQANEKRKQKNLTIIGLALGGVGVAVAIYVRKKNAAAAAAAPAGGTSSYSYPTLAGDTSGGAVDTTGLTNALTAGFQSLSGQIAGLSQSGAAPGAALPPPSVPALSTLTLAGSGYIPTADWGPTPGSVLPNPETVASGTYVPLAGQGLSSYASTGNTLYYQFAPGSFLPYSGGTQLAPGTPLFAKQ